MAIQEGCQEIGADGVVAFYFDVLMRTDVPNHLTEFDESLDGRVEKLAAVSAKLTDLQEAGFDGTRVVDPEFQTVWEVVDIATQRFEQLRVFVQLDLL